MPSHAVGQRTWERARAGAAHAAPPRDDQLEAMGFGFGRRRVRAGEQVVVVTGASSGVGRAIARAFAREGARIALIARSQASLEAAAREVTALGGEPMVLPLDVSDAAAVERAAAEVERRFGRIDTWVNNAMVSVLAPALETRPEEYRRVMEVNYLGYVHGTLSALRRMVPRDAGVVVQIGSALAYRSIPLQSAYCASKAAIRGFTDSLRSELIHERSRVRLSHLHLPALNTPQFDVVRSRLPRRSRPVGAVFQPEIVARACVRVAERPVRELWIAGSTVKAIVGQRLVPWYADWRLASVAWEGQMTDEPEPPGRPDNVDTPVAGDRGAHGRFGDEARSWSLQVALRMHPLATALAALGLAAVAGGFVRSRLR
jgi:NAD(P)-dependent dehydrogenase (short-subunit alcohol dehydrogenase family)